MQDRQDSESSLWRRRTTRLGPSWGLSSYCRGSCMTDVSMGNHTKLVISYGCTPPFWLLVTRRNFTIPGKDHIVYSRGQRTAPTRQSLRNPRERTVVHFNRLKPCTTATAEQPSALDHISPSPGDDNSTKDTPQAAPIGTHLEIIELMEPHAQEQQLPSPPSRIPTVPSRRYPTRSRQPPDRFGELIPI